MRADPLSTGTVAAICRVSSRTVATWLDRGLLKGYHLPGRGDRRVLRADLVAFLAANGMPAEWIDEPRDK